jgi:hypothetical protein
MVGALGVVKDQSVGQFAVNDGRLLGASIAPGGGALLRVGVDDDDALTRLAGSYCRMHCKRCLTAAALLAEKSYLFS